MYERPACDCCDVIMDDDYCRACEPDIEMRPHPACKHKYHYPYCVKHQRWIVEPLPNQNLNLESRLDTDPDEEGVNWKAAAEAQSIPPTLPTLAVLEAIFQVWEEAIALHGQDEAYQRAADRAMEVVAERLGILPAYEAAEKIYFD